QSECTGFCEGRLRGGDRDNSRRLHPARTHRDWRLADRADRDRVARHPVPLEGQQSLADRGDCGCWTDRVSGPAAELGDGALVDMQGDAMEYPFRKMFAVSACLVSLAGTPALSQPADRSADALQLEARIPLGDVRGRIDHMTVDPKRHRLIVAELGNDTVSVVD